MIDIQNISKTFKGVTALENISLGIPSKCLYGFIGPDGAGKTTLFRIITSLMVPDSGSITINGADPVNDYKKVRKFIGYMPGRFSLYQDLTVEENLAFYATIFGTTIEENYSIIKNVYTHIKPFKTRLARNLSGGMKQKLALSCALIHNPDVLVLDEPTTGVDAVSRKEFWELLNELRNKGMTIVVSTPYMDEASLCDNVALIHKGRILEQDKPGNIANKYRNILYAVSTNKMYDLVNDLREYIRGNSAYLFGQNVHYSSSEKINIQLAIQYLKNKGHSDVTFNIIEPTIEDTFISAIDSKEEMETK